MARAKPCRSAASKAPASIPTIPASGELAKLVSQIADHLIAGRVTKLLQHRGETFLGQKLPRGPGGKPAPGEEQKTGATDLVSWAGQQHCVAQRRFLLDAPRLPRHHCGRCECEARCRQAAGPPLLQAHDRVQRADGSACEDGDILQALCGKGLRVGDCPARDGTGAARAESPTSGRLSTVARGRFGAKNHLDRMNSRGAFARQINQNRRACRCCFMSGKPYRTYFSTLANHGRFPAKPARNRQYGR